MFVLTKHFGLFHRLFSLIYLNELLAFHMTHHRKMTPLEMLGLPTRKKTISLSIENKMLFCLKDL